jgi:anaerobic magnesium-protoporphyrin IX monomethyl ester cyclase
MIGWTAGYELQVMSCLGSTHKHPVATYNPGNEEHSVQPSQLFPQPVDIMLINPPTGYCLDPLNSIPVLAAYLNAKGITTAVLDSSQEFYHRLLTTVNIREGKEFVEARFMELNSRQELQFSESYEYLYLHRLLMKSTAVRGDLAWLCMPFSDYSDIQNSGIQDLLIGLASSRFFPETLVAENLFSLYDGLSPQSTSHLIRAATYSKGLAQTFSDIMDDALLQYLPVIIGFSVVFADQILPTLQMARVVKRVAPKIHVTLGGPYISVHFRELREVTLFDFVDSLVLDEGEIPLERMFHEMVSKAPRFAEIPNIVYREKGEIRYNPCVMPPSMESMPAPDYNVFDLNRYPKEKERLTLPFRLSRGCSWRRCSFCRTNISITAHYEQPSYDYIYHQLTRVISETGVRNFYFSDESAHPLLLEYISKRLIEDRLDISWRAHTRVSELLTRERCGLFKEAGCKQLNFGIECLNNRILSLMRKGITVDLVSRVLERIGGVLPIGAYMMVGFPSETVEEAVESFDRINSFKDKGLIYQYFYSPFVVVSGSDIHLHPEQFGVSDIRFFDGDDLSPDTSQFSSQGMSWEQCRMLFKRFSGAEDYESTYPGEPKEFELNGKGVKPRYDLVHILGLVEKTREIRHRSFAEWLRYGNSVVQPLRARLPKNGD